MNSNLCAYRINRLLCDKKCVDSFTIKVENDSQNVTLNVLFTDCKKRLVFDCRMGKDFHLKANKTLGKLADWVAEKNKALKENG